MAGWVGQCLRVSEWVECYTPLPSSLPPCLPVCLPEGCIDAVVVVVRGGQRGGLRELVRDLVEIAVGVEEQHVDETGHTGGGVRRGVRGGGDG